MKGELRAVVVEKTKRRPQVRELVSEHQGLMETGKILLGNYFSAVMCCFRMAVNQSSAFFSPRDGSVTNVGKRPFSSGI